MSTEYAPDQPAGFQNRIERVAIVGASGQVGQPIVEALLQTGKHTITALTRHDSPNRLPPGIHSIPVDYSDENTLITALQNQQLLIICLAATAPPSTQETLITAAAKAGIKHIMPNAWGGDTANTSLAKENLTGTKYTAGFAFAEAQGLYWTSMCNSFWYESALAMPLGYGFDLRNRKVTFFDDGTTRINTSTWQQCGRAVAAFLSLPLLPTSPEDPTPTISLFRNRPLYISSFLISQRDMLASINRVQGTSDSDWEISHETSAARYERGVEMLSKKDFSGFLLALFSRTMFPNGGGDYESTRGLDNEKLGLPKEDLDKATARALKMASEGWNQFDGRGSAKVYD